MRIGKRLFAWLYNTYLSPVDNPDPADAFTQELRAPLVGRAAGDMLEIGAGNGGNLPYLPADVRLTLLDTNPYMLRYLRERAARLSLPAYRALVAGAERMLFSDQAIRHLHAATGGVPRLLNHLATQALIEGMARGHDEIDGPTVAAVLEDDFATEGTTPWREGAPRGARKK